MNATFPITIIGGGIAGLSTAIALRRSGFAVRVYERNQAAHELGAGITLWANAVAIVDRWGIAEELRSRGNVIESGEMMDTHGRQLVNTPVGAVSRQVGSSSVGIHRAELLSILLSALPDNQVNYAADCVGIEFEPDGILSRFADGRLERSSLVIGADGIRSAVFRALHGNVPLRYAGYVCYRGIATYPGADLPFGHAFEAWGRGRRFGIIGLDSDRVYWFANENDDPGERVGVLDLPRLREVFDRWPSPIAQVLDAADAGTTYRHAIYDRAYRKGYRGRGRVALVGDAAHPMTPDLGQGACQAIEDADALAHSLASAVDEVAGLRAYEESRWQRVSWIVRRSRFQGWVGQHSSRVGCWLRDLLMRWTPASMMRNVFQQLVKVRHFGRTRP